MAGIMERLARQAAGLGRITPEQAEARGLMRRTPDGAIVAGDSAIHNEFGLSYAAYLVVPRSVLQSMPLEFQDRFVAMMREMAATIEFDPPAPFEYRVDYGYWAEAEPEYDADGNQTNRDDDPVWVPNVDADPLLDYERGRRRVPWIIDGLRADGTALSFRAEPPTVGEG